MKYLLILMFLLSGCARDNDAIETLVGVAASPTNCISRIITMDGAVIKKITICDSEEFKRRGCDLTEEQIQKAKDGKEWRK